MRIQCSLREVVLTADIRCNFLHIVEAAIAKAATGYSAVHTIAEVAATASANEMPIPTESQFAKIIKWRDDNELDSRVVGMSPPTTLLMLQTRRGGEVFILSVTFI